MLNLTDIIVRLGGRTILDGASAALPPRGRIGLIGRNGAGKTTLVRVVAGMLDPDAGELRMPRGSRIGYIAQDAPGGSATPFETVLAADVERAALIEEAEHSHDPDRLGELHERLNAIDAHSAPARAARILVGLGFDEAAQHRPLAIRAAGSRCQVTRCGYRDTCHCPGTRHRARHRDGNVRAGAARLHPASASHLFPASPAP